MEKHNESAPEKSLRQDVKDTVNRNPEHAVINRNPKNKMNQSLEHAAVCQGSENPINPVMRDHVPYFMGISLLYALCFTIAFYKNFIGLTFPLITAATLAVCWMFLKKNEIPWHRSNWWYLGGSLLLGISTVLTANEFVIFFNTAGILLLITVFMIRQVYDGKKWNLGQYICNILFLYLCMVPEVASPFIHYINYRKKDKKEEKKNQNTKYIFMGILIGLPILLIATGLLSSADQIFSRFVGSVFHNFQKQIVFSPNLFLIISLMLMGFFGIYSFLSALTQNNMPEWKKKGNRKNPVTAITFLSMITAVYLIFCGIQAVFLFTGGRLLPEGYTYSEYAHQGFFQLLVLCIFNLILVVLCLAVFQKNRMLNVLLLVFSGCTYIMIASSAFRMILYISVYHLSFLRILVLWFLSMLVVLMAGAVLHVIKEKFDLFRYCTAVVTVFYLLFSFGRADYIIASYNMAQVGTEIGYEDVAYLTSLSADAVPALSRYEFAHEHSAENIYKYGGYTEDVYGTVIGLKSEGNRDGYVSGCRQCKLEQKYRQVLEKAEGMNWRTFHFSRYWAAKAAEKYFR